MVGLYIIWVVYKYGGFMNYLEMEILSVRGFVNVFVDEGLL